ncbi:unnamed protein product [Mytilus coruscus]|uniref:ZMYM2-like/QRICH1 C-terminal domain-containing protein n=1 Tax=Mytilus coruscus TaxID=42192 RepID=A0A6J8EQK6_MYTCO|nr:unnamed protein product [Mytilus coruscus]
MKERANEGLGANTRKQADVISVDEETSLYDKGILGMDNPQQLLNTLLYLCGLHFALKGGTEHRRLRLNSNPQITGPFQEKDAKLRYLLYKKDVSKANAGGLNHRKVVSKCVRAFENPENRNKCIVTVFEKYKSLCKTPIGHNTLQGTVKRLCTSIGLTGKRTNHSLRASAAIRLYNAGIEEQRVAETTGHRSIAVRVYKGTSADQQIEASNILYGLRPSDGSKKAKPSAAAGAPVGSASVECSTDESDRKTGRLTGFTPRHRRLKSDAVPTVFAYNQGLRDDSNSQTRKRVLYESKPLMVDVGVQTLPQPQLQTDTDFGTSMTSHSYLQVPSSSTQPLDTVFISSPQKDQDASDASTPTPTSSPEKPDSDLSYVPSDESRDTNQSSTSDSSQHITTKPKFIAFESCLKSLFARVICTDCGELIAADESEITYNGSAMKVKFLCMKGHQTLWESQPLVNNKPAGNLMVATAVILSGETFSRLSHFAEILSLKFIGSTQFYSLQKDVAIPAIDHYYTMQRDVILQQLHGKQLILGGDGRCDSPGFSAKYCTYTSMDSATGVIPDFSLVQVSETTSSNKMELIGFQRSLASIEAADLTVGVVVTDRHVQIRKAMATDHSDKKHQFDVWHLSKSIKKKILAIKPKKLLNEVKPWIHHLQAYAALEKVVTDKLILRDRRQLDLFCHTGALETYHSMMLKYWPKRLEFEYASMVARTQLAVVDNNVNIGRNQKTDANGKLSFATRCPKSTGRWTARKIYEKKDYDFKADILQFAVTSQQEGPNRKTIIS